MARAAGKPSKAGKASKAVGKATGKASKWLKGLPPEFVLLALSDASRYSEANIALVKNLVDAQTNCVYITVNKPAQSLTALFEQNGIPLEHTFFIDCAAGLVGGERGDRVPRESSRSHNTILVAPQNLSGISIAVNELLKKLSGRTIVFFDSPATLAVYNQLTAMEKFTHFLVNRVRLAQASAVLTSVKGDLKQELFSSLTKFCDRVVTAS